MIIPIDPSRFLKCPVSPAEPLRPQDISIMLDAQTGFVYSLVTYPTRADQPAFLTVDGGNGQKINVKGQAALEIWAALNSPNPPHYFKLSDSLDFSDAQQFFDLDSIVLYLYHNKGRMTIVRPTGSSEVTIAAQAEALFNSLCQKAEG